MRAAARAILDEAGSDGVGLREAARRVGVSATAAYRHFDSKGDLLASVAAEGFWELSAAMRVAGDVPIPLIAVGLAYVEFALQKRGLFRLMFGPLLAERAKYPTLNQSVDEVFRFLQQVVTGEDRPHEDDVTTLAAWGLIHGLSTLVIDGLGPPERVRDMAKQILVEWTRRRTV